MTEVLHLKHGEVVQIARGISTGEFMVVDIDDRDWQASLALILGASQELPEKVGMIVVPVAPHTRGYWLNNKVPGVTLSLRYIHEDDVRAVQDEYKRMWEALHPGEESDGEEL